MLVVAGPDELAAAAGPVWGTGGWDAPADREARDWLCLARLCGWEVRLSADLDAPASRWIVLAREPPDDAEAARLAARLEREPLLVVSREPAPRSAWARIAGDGESFAPGIRVRPVGRGSVATLAFHPSAARDEDAGVTATLRRLLVECARAPVAWLDWRGTLALRMDDPGSCESAHHRAWSYPKLGRAAWRAIGEDLARRDARLTVAYVSGWVDDGDRSRGTLTVGGTSVERRAGAVVPSHLVHYAADGIVHDLVAEHAGLREQQARGVVEIEAHGHTHVHPDRAAWAAARSRRDDVSWYRDLGPGGEHAVAAGVAGVESAFGTRPRVLVPPGDVWTTAALRRALDQGLDLVDSYYLALRDGARWCWCQHVCAPYLDAVDPAWFAAEVPVVGYFHDMEPSVHGVGWLVRHLDAWQDAGAVRLVGLRELAAALDARLRFDGETLETGPLEAPRPVPVRVHGARGASVTVRGRRLAIGDDGVVRVPA